MDTTLKVVTKLPLTDLWNEREIVHASRGRSLSQDDISGLLRLGPVQFVVASVGEKLRWIDPADCYEFWRNEAKPHLATPQAPTRLDDFPASYFFRASEWHTGHSIPILVLEKSH